MMSSVQERMSACLARIHAQDHRWRAMLALNPQAEAQALESGLKASIDGEPLHGFILAVKDNIDVAGMATTSGCKALAGAMPRQDAAVLRKLREAGVLIIGKTNLSEFSFEIRSRSSLGGDVLCPFAPHATAGGSSGGSAVAVACGYADGALGTDTGGSIRVPASCNGLVGFRPAHGALSMEGIAPLAPSTDTVGPITRNVDDALRLYRAMGGKVVLPPSVAGLRIGLLRQTYGEDQAIVAAVEAAASRLWDHGVELIDPLRVEGLEALIEGPHIVDVEFASAFNAYLAHNFQPGTAPASLADILESGQYLADYSAVLKARLAANPDAVGRVLERHDQLAALLKNTMGHYGLDGLLYPTMRVIPQDLANPKGGWAPELAARTGWPAITVPVAPHGAVRPIGAELLAPTGQEGLIFALARLMGTT